MQHGIGAFVLLSFLWRTKLAIHHRLIAVALLEAGWELVENTKWMIQRYREVTISLDYFGDSIFNSCGDLTSCMIGAWIAVRIRPIYSVVLFVALELTSICWIRDSLLINIIMLLCPIDAIRQWQVG